MTATRQHRSTAALCFTTAAPVFNGSTAALG